MRAKSINTLLAGCIGCLAVLTAGCGEFVRQDRSPVTLVIEGLQAASGAEPDELSGTLRSDVRTNGSIFNDVGSVTMRLILKDQGTPANPTAPSATNAVTIQRYRVTFRRSQTNSTPGVDVPYPFDSAMTFTIPPSGTVTAGFELIRHTAKLEAPLAALAGGLVIISTVADITFYGRDQAGNDVTASGSIGVLFGDFADPDGGSDDDDDDDDDS